MFNVLQICLIDIQQNLFQFIFQDKMAECGRFYNIKAATMTELLIYCSDIFSFRICLKQTF
ncbi:hypothetical protein EGI22_00780 [Lacihabitans sp. LS3-19]|nr:hypothetical protein [Lacihabitans sp. LS3-19]